MGVDDLAVELETIAKLKAENEKLREALKVCRRDYKYMVDRLEITNVQQLFEATEICKHRMDFIKPIFEILDKTNTNKG